MAAAAGSLASWGCGGAPRPRPAALHLPRFASLAAPVRPSDALPAQVRASLARSTRPRFTAADVRAARRLIAGVWLVPAAGGDVCFVHYVYATVARIDGRALPPALARVCASEAQAQSGQLFEAQSLTSSAYAVRARIVGVVPDGVARVTVHDRRGARSVAVVRNAYRLVAREPTALAFVQRQGGRRVARSLPISLVQARNSAPLYGPPRQP